MSERSRAPDEKIQLKPVELLHPVHLWVDRTNRLEQRDPPALQATRLPEQDHWVREQMSQMLGASGADVKLCVVYEKIQNRTARRNEALVPGSVS